METILHNLRNTVEYMKCGLKKKNRIIRDFIKSEYGRISYHVRYSNNDRDYRENTLLVVKVSEGKYQYIEM